MSRVLSCRPYLFVAFSVLAGCGGHGGASSLPPVTSAQPPVTSAPASGSSGTAARARVTFSVFVPAAPPGTAARRRAYVSSATQSLALSASGTQMGSVDVGASSPSCTSTSGGYACATNFNVPIGTNTFTISAFDGPNATGHVLSTATTPATIVAGSANTIAATLDGVIASLALGLPPAPIVQGTAATLALSVTALDAAHRTIVGDPYANPVSLTGGDPTHATLSATTVASPADAVTVAYDGTRLTAQTYTATVAGVSPASVTLAAPKTPFTDDWTTFGHDSARTGADAQQTTLTTSNVGQLQQRYTIGMSSFVDAQPVVATNVAISGAYRDVAYVGDEHGKFVAFDVATGDVLWTKQLGAEAVGAANCSDIPDGTFGITGTAYIDRTAGRVYVADGLDVLWAFDLATGQVAGARGNQAAWPGNGLPLLGSTGNPSTEHIYSGLTFNPVSGDLYVPTASICDNGTWNGRLVAVNLAAASVAKSYFTVTSPSGAFGGGIWGPGGVSLDPRGNGDVYTAIGNAEPSDRDGLGDTVARWTANLGLLGANLPDTSSNTTGLMDDDFGATPVVFQAPGCSVPQLTVLQKSGNAYVYSLDGLTGIGASPAQSQTISMGSSNQSGDNIGVPAYDGGIVIFSNGTQGTEQRGLVAYSDVNCMLVKKWAYVDPSQQPSPGSPPTIASGVVYAGGGTDNVVRAFDESSGNVLWTSPSLGFSAAAPTVSDGALLVSSWDNTVHVYALPAQASHVARRVPH